jgi:hypothetical protein
MFLNRFIVSLLVFSPTESRIVSEQIPIITPAIMKNVRSRFRDMLRHAIPIPDVIRIFCSPSRC